MPDNFGGQRAASSEQLTVRLLPHDQGGFSINTVLTSTPVYVLGGFILVVGHQGPVGLDYPVTARY